MKTLMSMLAAAAIGLTAMTSAPADASGKKGSKVLTGTLNLNTATAAQLDLMPGVGPKAADRIISYRTKTPFTRPEELVKVKGFGKKKLEKLRAHLSVSGPTTLRVVDGEGVDSSSPPPAAQGRATSPKR